MASRVEWWWVENGEWHHVLNGGGLRMGNGITC